jgi:hypothetical protein
LIPELFAFDLPEGPWSCVLPKAAPSSELKVCELSVTIVESYEQFARTIGRNTFAFEAISSDDNDMKREAWRGALRVFQTRSRKNFPVGGAQREALR